MANVIRLKRSSTASNVPTAGELNQGELAINLADERLFSKNSSNVVFELTDHDNLTNYVANEHIDWTSTSVDLNTTGVGFLGTLDVSGTATIDSWLTLGGDLYHTATYLDVRKSTTGAGGIRLLNSVGSVQGYLYTDGSATFGLLHSGGGWAVQIAPASNTVTLPGLLNANGGIAFNNATDAIAGIQNQNLVDKTATEVVTGAWTLDGPVTTADYGTGGRVKDGTDVARPIGFNVLPVYEIDANDSFDLAHNGMLWHKDAGGAVDFTCPNDANIPQGATYAVHNDDTEALDIVQGSGVTVYWLEAGAAPLAGNVTVAQGGIVTVYKYTDTEWWVWGSKDAGSGGGATTLNGLTDVTITTANTGDLLRFNGTAWVDYPDSNYAPAGSYLEANVAETVTAGWTFDALTFFLGGIRLYDNDQVQLGTGDDARLYFDGVDDVFLDMDDAVNFRIRGGTSGTEAMINCLANGEVGLYYNGALKLSTTNVGINVTGRVDADDFGLDDNQSLFLGTGDDIEMYFNATDFYIDMAVGADFRLRGGASGTDQMITAIADGSVFLYYNSGLALQTLDPDVAPNVSSIRIYDHANTARPGGFNDLKNIVVLGSTSSTYTLSNLDVGAILTKTGTSAATSIILPSSTTEFPEHSICQFIYTSPSAVATVTLNASTNSRNLYWLDGSAVTGGASTNRTLSKGCVVTIYRQDTANYFVWGAGIS